MISPIKTTVFVDEASLVNKLESLINDDEVMLQIHNLFAKMCDPYVPMDEGHLAQTVNITPNYIEYTQPYAHYMYEGIIYGPNIPITKDGVIVGWRSIPGKKKTPTGRPITYYTGRHPLARRHWDKGMMEDKGEEFIAQVKEILERKADSVSD